MWSAWWSSNYKFCGTSNWNCLISSYHSSLSCPLFISELVLSKFVLYLSFPASFLVDPSLILFLDLFLACVILLLLVCVVSLQRLMLVGQRWAQAADGVLMTCHCQGLLLCCYCYCYYNSQVSPSHICIFVVEWLLLVFCNYKPSNYIAIHALASVRPFPQSCCLAVATNM